MNSEKCVVLFDSNSVKILAWFSMNSDKKCVMFGSISLKVWVWLDMNYEKKCLVLLCIDNLNVRIVWYELLKKCVVLYGSISLKCQNCLVWTLKKSIYYCLVVPLWKCQNFLVWILKCVLLNSISLKCHYSLIWTLKGPLFNLFSKCFATKALLNFHKMPWYWSSKYPYK